MTDQYNGPERRHEFIKLDEALGEIEKLRGAATTLATAVVNTAQRDELDALRQEIKDEQRKRNAVEAALSLAIILVIIMFFNIKINHLNGDVKKGHDVITCLQGKTEAQRTGEAGPTALLLCTQTQKG